jgi:serine/threonine-protein kinase
MNADTQQAGEMPTNAGLNLTPEQRRAVEEFRKRHRTALLALLFTDVEGSTALRNEMGELPAADLIERHKGLLREVLAGFADAQEISTAGDSVFFVFAKPSDAVRFALLTQKQLRDLAARERPDFRVRMGIHLGEVVVEEDATGGPMRDVLGMQVDIAARVTALAGGGQILMTRGVFDNARQILKGQSLPGIVGLTWLSHGPYLLKGFDEPLAICEVGETTLAPLRQPADCQTGKRATVPGTEPVLGWRPAVEQVVPGTEWELEKKLGEGGFGEVWLARHRAPLRGPVRASALLSRSRIHPRRQPHRLAGAKSGGTNRQDAKRTRTAFCSWRTWRLGGSSFLTT